MKKLEDKTVYFQPPGIRPQFCEAGMISETDPEYIWYYDEPCKILISEVKIIPKEDVIYDKKKRYYLVKSALYMNELKFKWSISTIKIFLDNGNTDINSEIITNKEYLQRLVKKLKTEYKEMFLNDQEETITGKKYFVAINEIEDWITNCH